VVRRWSLTVWSAFSLAIVAAPAAAEPLAPDSLEHDGYRLSLETRQSHVTGRHFSEPLLLFQQPVERISVDQLKLALGVRFALSDDFELSATLSVAHRRAAVRLAPIVLSPEQTLPATWLELENFGFLDAKLGAFYRVFELGPSAFGVGANVTLPTDDNPASHTLPKKVPLSTGQARASLAPTISLAFERFHFTFDYELAYHPTAAATYLVRRIENQSYVNGALGDFFTHDFRLVAAFRASELVTLELSPFGAIEQNPTLIDRGQKLPFVYRLLRYELGASARVRLRLSRRHALTLSYEQPFLRDWEADPFFPIVLPEQGFGVAWRLSGS
jgi:hypothetical protein